MFLYYSRCAMWRVLVSLICMFIQLEKYLIQLPDFYNVHMYREY